MNPLRVGAYTQAEEMPPKRRRDITRRWRVTSTQDGAVLGRVEWYGPWRCYAFYPAPDTVYEERCLKDLAVFCGAQTQNQRAAAKARREARVGV